jgi:hypothetical protein
MKNNIFIKKVSKLNTKIFKTFFLFILSIVSISSSSAASVGHRDPSGNPILDVTLSTFQSNIQTQLNSTGGFGTCTVISADIQDYPSISGYFTALNIVVTIPVSGTSDVIKLSMQYALTYNSTLNEYHGDVDVTPGASVNGGKLNYCEALNCIGCNNTRNDKGVLLDCTPCLPIYDGNGNPPATYSCTVHNTSNAGPIAQAVKSVFDAIKGLF